MTTKCPSCQFENPESVKFCGECGTPLPFPGDIHPEVTKTLQTPVREIAIGSTFANRYQIIEELGKGGMGKVYKVFDIKIKEKVALKLIKPEIATDRQTIERFSNELRLARKIRHKNVCGMFDLAETESMHYITMEYVHGEDLKSMIQMMGQLSSGKIVSIGKQVCEGLAEAHSLGVVHRDLKPSNIMIDKNGNAKIMDFGIARSIREKGITGPNILIGTPEYMSPEQAEAKEVDQRSDLYSLGVILYEMATSRVPFEGETALSIAMKHKTEIPKDPKSLNPHIPDDLSRLILKCLEKDEAKRYQSAEDIRDELEKIENGIPTADRIIPKKKASTSREITVTFGLKKVFMPILGILIFIIAAVVIWQIFPKKEAAPLASAKNSIAVLPFVDLSQAKDHEYLCDGISETLINALTNIEGIWIPAQTSAFFFKGKAQDIREIGRKLGVDNVLEGSVQVAGDDLRVTARISSAHDGRQVWSEIYSRKMADIFTIQDDIAKAIVATMRIKLLGEKGAPLVKNSTENYEAYSLYLQGRSYWNRKDWGGLTKSIEYFEKAIEVDPNYALAHAGLGDAYFTLWNLGFWSIEEAFPKAKEAALKAIELDGSLAEAHASLAAIMRGYDWDFAGAEKEFKLAIELNPGYATAHHQYAWLLSTLGRHDEAIRESKIARNLDPLSPSISANVGTFLYFARQYDEAIEELNKALGVNPDNQFALLSLGFAYEATGKYEDAVKCFNQHRGQKEWTEDVDVNLAGCYALMRKREEARKIADNLISYSKGNFFHPETLARVFSALGDKEQAFAWLERAFRERDPYLLIYLRTHHRYDVLRSDPRYMVLLRKIGLEK